MLIINSFLSLRKPDYNDISDLLEVKNDKEAASLTGGQIKLYSQQDIRSWIDFHNNNKDEDLFVIVSNGTNKVIGHVGLYKIDQIVKKAEYGILIGNKEFRGKGIGKVITDYVTNYAFQKLHLHRIVAEVISENIPSKSMFLKCGYKIEGELVDDNYKNGRYYNVLIMSILNKQ